MYEASGELQAKQLTRKLDILKHKLNNLLLNCSSCNIKTKNQINHRTQRSQSNILHHTQSLMSSRRPSQEQHEHRRSPYLENLVNRYAERNSELEERETELKRRLEVMESMAPAIMMFNMFRLMKNEKKDIASATIAQLKRIGGKDLSPPVKSKCSRKEASIIYENYEQKLRMLETEHKQSSSMCIDIDEKIKALEDERKKLIDVKQNMEKKVQHLEVQLTDLKQFAPLRVPSLTSILSEDYDLDL